MINRGPLVNKLGTFGRFNYSVLASVPQLVVKIILDGIIMATILAKITLVWRLTNMEATLMLRTFDLLFLFMHYL